MGIYTLVVFLSEETCLNVGRLGFRRFPKGYYAYTGSALGTGVSSLRNRVSRHLKKEKSQRWHIDFLLANENTVVTAVVAVQTNKKAECAMNRHIKENTRAKITCRGFGASDCKEKCESHLLYFGEKDVKEKIAKLYAENFGSRCLLANFG